MMIEYFGYSNGHLSEFDFCENKNLRGVVLAEVCLLRLSFTIRNRDLPQTPQCPNASSVYDDLAIECISEMLGRHFSIGRVLRC